MVTAYHIVPSCMCSGAFMEVKFTTMVLFNAVGDIFTSFVLVWVIIKLARVGWYMPSIGQFWVPFFKKFTEWDSFLCNHFNIFFVDGDKLLDNVCYVGAIFMDESLWFNLMALLKCFLNFSYVGFCLELTQCLLFLLELKKLLECLLLLN